MTDRELIEAAAKAAGIALVPYIWDKGAPWGEHAGFTVAGAGPDEWNPLEDDGQALRLAVVRRVDLSFFGAATIQARYGDGPIATEYVNLGADHNAATRRAIVRAAAALAGTAPGATGETM